MCHIRRHDRTTSFFCLSSFISLLYISFFLPLFIYPLLSNFFMRFLLTSRNIFSLTLDLFHLVHPLAYDTRTHLVYMDTCARVQSFVIEQDRSLETKKWFLNDYGVVWMQLLTWMRFDIIVILFMLFFLMVNIWVYFFMINLYVKWWWT